MRSLAMSATLVLLLGACLGGCIEADHFGLFDQAEVVTFALEEESLAAVVDPVERTISVFLSEDAKPSKVHIADLQISSLASASVEVGERIDLRGDFEFVVTAEDGSKATWTVLDPTAPAQPDAGAGDAGDCETTVVTYQLRAWFQITTTPGGLGDADNEVGPGEIELRFSGDAASGGDGPLDVLSYRLPMVFTVSAPGTNVTTDVVATAGPDACGLATGQIAGTQGTWQDCDYGPAPPHGTTDWGIDKVVGGPGCIAGYHSEGTISCTGSVCSSVGLGSPIMQDDTWSQPLNTFVFATNRASFQMRGEGNPPQAGDIEGVEVPNSEPSRTWLRFDGVETARRCEPAPTCP